MARTRNRKGGKCPARRKLFQRRKIEGKADYGPAANAPDLPTAELVEEMALFLEKLKESAEGIEARTRGQRDDDSSHDERRKRITASNFGVVCRRKEKTPVKNLVLRLLYSTNTRCYFPLFQHPPFRRPKLPQKFPFPTSSTSYSFY